VSRRLFRRRRRGERGVAIVEMALVAPLLLLLVFGIAEFGVALTNANRLETAVSTAARVASSSGSTTDADRNVLLSLKAALPANLLSNVTRVVIYSSNANGDMASSCMSVTAGSGVGGGGAANGASSCNTYSGTQLRNLTLSPDNSATVLGSSRNNWPASTRRDRLSGPPDYIGVLVVTSSTSITGTYWNSFSYTKKSVYRIQPDIDG
jgi:Flp pilus assembly protein TadG